MAVNFSVQFRINEKTQSRVLRLTDTSTGFTLAKGNFSVTFPDGSTRIKTDFNSPDITTAGGFVDVLLVTDVAGVVLTGSYKIDFVALDGANTSYPSTKTFDFNWTKPEKKIVSGTDVLVPEVRFLDNTSYSPAGSFTGTVSRTFSTLMPSNTPQSGTNVIGVGNLINPVFSGNYYEGIYTVKSDISITYTHGTNSWLTLFYTDLLQEIIEVKRAPTQTQLIGFMNTYHAAIEAYEEKNDTQFNLLNEQYDLVVALYSHIIARYESGTLDGSEPLLTQLLDILRPYNAHTYTSAPLTPFTLDTIGTTGFVISNGTVSDNFSLGETLLFSSGSAALVPTITNNSVIYTPTFGVTPNTFASGSDSRFHDPVTLGGSTNGLSLSTQQLSLATATTSAGGAMSAIDKAKLDGIAAGAQTGTVTSIGISMPSAFTVSNSPITTLGTIAITANGSSAEYIRGDGATGNFNSVAREAISLTTTGTSGAATYSSTTGVLNIPQYVGGVTSFNTRTGAITLTSGDVTTALTFTPYNATNPSNYISRAGISAGTGISYNSTTGVITNTITQYTDALARLALTLTTTGTSGAATYNSTTGVLNIPAYQGGVTSFNTRTGSITLTSGDVTTALTYTPESAANKGIAGGYASLDGGGLVPSTQLPSYVDDVLEFANLAALPTTGETGKIYVTLDSNKIYRWSGSAYIEVSPAVGTIWGGITGTLSNQTDLQSALNAKQDDITLTTTGTSGAATFIGNTLNIPQYQGGVTSFNTRTGAVTLSSGDVTTALGFTPYNATNPSGYITTSALSGYVPYTNATTNVDLGEYSIKSGAFKFDLTPSGTLAEGTMQWNSSDGTVDIGLKGGNVVLQVGQETVYEVRNETGSTILSGTALYANGVTAGSGRITAGAYVADGSIREVRFLGLATEDISNGVNGFVTHFGYVRGLDTRGTSSSSISVGDETWAVGDILYVHPTVAGKLTNVKPQHEITVAIIITRHQSSGVLFVRPSSAGHLEDIHDVAISSVANNEGLFYDSASGLWKNKTIATVLGYTPQAALTNPVTGTGTTNTLPKWTSSSALGNSNITDSGSLITLGSNTNISSGGLGIGTTSLTGFNLRIAKTLTGATTSYGILVDSITQSDVTLTSNYYQTFASVQNTAFTLQNLNHFNAVASSSFGSATVVTQIGYNVSSNLIGATNNFAFRGQIPLAVGTNRWNIYMDGTANNYLAGSLGIGTTNLTGVSLSIQKTITGAATSFGVLNSGQIQSDVTAARYFNTSANVASGTTITGGLNHYLATQGTISGTVNEQNGFNVNSSLTGATVNYGFRGQIPSGTNRWNIYMDGNANNYLAGGLGIGGLSFTGSFGGNLFIGKAITGNVNSNGVGLNATIQSDVTSVSVGYFSALSTQAATFTINQIRHFQASQGTFGAGSTIDNQYGFWTAGLTGATNNYGFFGNIAVGTGRWNLYMQGTANNFLGGSLGIGTTQPNTTNLYIRRNLTGATTMYTVLNESVIQSDVTSSTTGFFNQSNTQAASFTLGTYSHFQAAQGGIGAGSAITTQQGFVANAGLTGATNNYGFRGLIPAGTGRWNLFMDGTASNHISGVLAIGTTTPNASAKLQVDSTSQGFLPPRMTATQRAAIASPAEGLVVVQTDGVKGMYLYIDAAWHALTML